MMPIDRESTAPTAPGILTKSIKLIKNQPPVESTVSPDFMTIASGHNTYRPDVYRTSEGYLN